MNFTYIKYISNNARILFVSFVFKYKGFYDVFCPQYDSTRVILYVFKEAEKLSIGCHDRAAYGFNFSQIANLFMLLVKILEFFLQSQ